MLVANEDIFLGKAYIGPPLNESGTQETLEREKQNWLSEIKSDWFEKFHTHPRQ